MSKSPAILYAYYLSSCSWRVRLALHMKGIPYEERSVDIVKQREQITEQFRAINPMQKVPALVIDNATIVESMSIVQYLEETRPDPPLTPSTPLLRARMREICDVIVSGIQPLQNVGLRPQFESAEKHKKFCEHWTLRGLAVLEDLLPKSAGKYCVENQITMADICLVPQVYNAVSRYAVDLKNYPTVSKVYETLLKEKVFQDTHPENVKSMI